MKKFRYTKFFAWLAAATLLLTTSCKDDMLFGNGTSDEVTVTFTLAPEAAAPIAATRGVVSTGENGYVTYPTKPGWRDNGWGTISDGSKADVLIYALYDSEGNLLEGYSDGTDDELKKAFGERPGQTIKKIDTFPVVVTLTLKRDEEYTIAFWAQSSKTQAYDTEDLRKVEVKYSELDKELQASKTRAITKEATTEDTTTPNNDEFRDVFCNKETFTAGDNGGITHDIFLYRPLAQINVGTSGYDFESITRNADKKYLYSKIRLNRVARYFDVVKDMTYATTTSSNENEIYSQDDDDKTAESFAVADFGYAPLPAYVNYRQGNSEKYDLPTYPSYTKWNWEYDRNFTFPHLQSTTGDNDGETTDENITNYDAKTLYSKEQFLKVRLYDASIGGEETPNVDAAGNRYTPDKDEDGYRDYANHRPDNASADTPDYDDCLSETFKYLSMCYVLTSSTKDDKILINNVKVWLATDENGDEEVEIVNLNNVPAQRNWRTNIVGNLLTEKTSLHVSLDRDFAGDFNAWNSSKDNWSGPLAKGVYYDAINDEIQISDKDGLLWFQRMVNGKLVVRDATNINWSGKSVNNKDIVYKYSSTVGQNYPYYKLKNNGEYEDATFDDYTAYEAPTDVTLKERILIATHQKYNDNSKGEWPTNCNFHFCGKNGPAHIRLMADIDLEGEEWIPIGWDVKVHDTSIGTYDATTSTYHDFKESDGKQRAFCGIFDGNNHTISNLHNRTFTAKVHDNAWQTQTYGPYDNVQWMPSGFFGMVGGWRTANTTYDTSNTNTKLNTAIKNLCLFNVTIQGYHTGAGIAAIVNSKDDAVEIEKCTVDGGTITLYPMFRGDEYVNVEIKQGTSKTDRTFARGIYAGGIVGQLVSKQGKVKGCEVRNLVIKAYRQVGGLVGSVSNKEQYTEKGYWANDFKQENLPTIQNNTVDNTVIIADKFQPYDIIFNKIANNVWQNGFGWKETQTSLANKFVGGTPEDEYDDGTNKATNTQYVEFNTGANVGTKVRKATIYSVPLKYIPMLSSWFCDDIRLNGNYYGETGVKFDRAYKNFAAWTYTNRDTEVSVPFKLPFETWINYEKDDKNTDYTNYSAAMYVESVTLDGKGGIGGRSVITPQGIDQNGAVMYVTARNWKQFYDLMDSKALSNIGVIDYKKPTTINNVVLRGTPYAHTGMMLVPTPYMSEVTLNNVAIYDVYQTLGQRIEKRYEQEEGKEDPFAEGLPKLTVNKSNFRGYTVPGDKWSQITYDTTTFERGASTGHGQEEYTYKAEAKTTFKNCFFKAPYIIDLSKAQTNNVSIKFDNNCYATATSTTNIKITTEEAQGCKRIVITSDNQGNPVVTYEKDTTDSTSAKRR